MKRIKNKQIKYEKLQPSKVPREKEKKMNHAVHLKLATKWKMPQCLRLASVNASRKNEGIEVSEGGQAGQAH